MFFRLLILILLLSTSLLAKAETTTIGGTLINVNHQKIYLYPDKRIGEFEKQPIEIYQRGIFSIKVDISYPQIAALAVGRSYITLYLVPGKSLKISADAAVFPMGINFEGEAGPDNFILQKYFEIMPPVKEFDKKYYPILGRRFPFTTRLEGYMLLYGPEDFRQKMLNLKSKSEQLYALPEYHRTSESFRQYLQGEINGYYNYALWSYALLFGKREKIQPDYFGLKEYTGGDINGPHYRNYLILYNLYLASLVDGENPHANTRYRLAEEHLEGTDRQLLLAEIVMDAIHNGEPEALSLYEKFISTYPGNPLAKAVDNTAYKDINLFFGEKAPDFTLETMDGSLVSLSRFEGKVVYIDFWASWCRPCLEKMEKLEAEKTKNPPAEDVVFITVSIDKSKEVWKRTLQNRKLSGIHLYAGKDAPILHEYKVSKVPAEFIIRKDGSFAPTPTIDNAENLIQVLSRLDKLN